MRMSQSLILINALSSACWEEKKEKKKKEREKRPGGLFSPRTWLACYAIKG
jgi:hypothetical protein